MGMENRRLKMAFEVKSVDSEQGIITGYPATWDRDREGDRLVQGAYAESFPAYMKTGGPLFWQHYWDEPIGKTTEIREDEHGVFAVGELRPRGKSKVVDTVRDYMSEGLVRGLSHSFRPIEWTSANPTKDPYGYDGRDISRAEFLEWGPVTVPANPQATAMFKSMFGDRGAALAGEPQAKRAAPFADLPIHDGEDPWIWHPAAANEILGEDRWERYAKAHAWADPAQRQAKSGYRLPFGTLIDGELHASVRGVKAAMASLLGARGGAQIPDEDRKGAYDHLAAYYQKAGLTPPEFHQAGESFSWGWFHHDEQKAFEQADFASTIHRLHGTITEARQFAASRRRSGWDPLAGSEDVARRALATLEDLLGRKGQSLDTEALLRSVGFDSVQHLQNAARFVEAARVEGSV